MMKSQKKIASGIMTAAGVAVAVIPLVETAAEVIHKGLVAHAETKEELIKIPELYDSDGRMRLDEAKQLLEKKGLHVGIMEVDPKMKYSTYLDQQVVGTKPRANTNVKPESLVTIKYVTSDVIAESKRLRMEYEKNKAENRESRKQARRKTVDIMKKHIVYTTDKARVRIKLLYKKGDKKAIDDADQ